MALISLTIEESEEELVYGFPRFVTVTANIACNIYYTFDGTNPTILSDIYVTPIKIPTEELNVILKIFATNGVDESSVITKEYQHGNVSNIRRFQTLTDSQPSSNKQLYPFGTNEYYPTTKFINIGDGSNVVYNPDLDGYSQAYDADGYQTLTTNKQYNTENYNIIYSTENADGTTGKGVGSLPAEVLLKLKTTPLEESEVGEYLFDPRSMVIFYDATKQKDSDPPIIATQFMSLEHYTQADSGKTYSTGIDTPSIYGQFIRSYHDPKTNTLTSYYYDNVANKWFIMKAAYTPKQQNNLSGYVMGRGQGGRFVHQWIPFQRRFLF